MTTVELLAKLRATLTGPGPWTAGDLNDGRPVDENGVRLYGPADLIPVAEAERLGLLPAGSSAEYEAAVDRLCTEIAAIVYGRAAPVDLDSDVVSEGVERAFKGVQS